MRAEHRIAVAACAALLSLSAPRAASAFCRTTTVPVPASFEPQPGTCFTQGEPLYHPSQCLGYEIATQPAGAISAKILSASFARAFATWSAPNTRCLPGITAVQVGTVDGPVQVGYTANAQNANVVGFVAGAWTHDASGSTLALTTLTFRAEDGRILDADTEINRDVKWSATRPLGPDDYDFDTAVLHETGHFLGLAHSAADTAAMYAAYSPGSFRAKLDDDDVAGICAIYPARDVRSTKTGEVASTACVLATESSSGSTCGEPNLVHGCTAASTTQASRRASSDAAWWTSALVLTLGSLVVARRRRARARATKAGSSG